MQRRIAREQLLQSWISKRLGFNFEGLVGIDVKNIFKLLHLSRCTLSKATAVAYPPLANPLRQVRLLTGRWHTLCCSGALALECAKCRLAKLVNLCIALPLAEVFGCGAVGLL